VSGVAGIVGTRKRRLLVLCERLGWYGGLLRFERVGAALRTWGDELAFAALSGDVTPPKPMAVPVLSADEAASTSWDAVMVPGAPFGPESLEMVPMFCDRRFGVRVQHVLNDQTRRRRFKAVNEVFAPDVVIFNNLAWPHGSFDDLAASEFHVLLGAVDTQRFRPSHTPVRRRVGSWLIGGLADKNPAPLVEALQYLPEYAGLRLYDVDAFRLAEERSDLVEAGRLELVGPLDDDALASFYHEVDCVAATERFAGWSNLAAEAMASGRPVVCTSHGTSAFARDGDTALVVSEPTPIELATAIRRLIESPTLCSHLAARAYREMAQYSWSEYTHRLLTLLDPWIASWRSGSIERR
jgi:glycosyltransferase involved in cell wall biosynthesis